MCQEYSLLARKYNENLENGRPVFDGHPLRFFAAMSAEDLYEYKTKNSDFEKSWVFKAILMNNGPVFCVKAIKGTDRRDIQTPTSSDDCSN